MRQLKEAQAQLEEDNAQAQPRLDIFEVGMKAADAHLSFLLISRCAFSRQTRAVLALEDANQVIHKEGSVLASTQAMHIALLLIDSTPRALSIQDYAPLHFSHFSILRSLSAVQRAGNPNPC